MLTALAGRLARCALTMLLLLAAVFVVARLTGNPVDLMLPPNASEADRRAMTAALGLDRPLVEQFVTYLGDIVTGDFGTSIKYHAPVTDLVLPKLGDSLLLAGAATLVALLVSVPMGIYAAYYRGRAVDRGVMIVSLFGQSLPTFVTGILSILVFAVSLHWLPATTRSGDWTGWVLPAVTLAYFISAGIVRLLRTNMIDSLASDHVQFARAMGASESYILWRHCLTSAAPPVITYLGVMYGVLLGSSVATEVIFNFPGIGRMAYDATTSRDFPLLQFITVVWAGVIVAINLVAEVVSLLLDPKQRQGAR
ncbi:ABC transporter permease [Nocardia sp. BMG51109]|uniref:ABC transporter permease n=1 Tax=Nocardia sp. BMG51109 TaxID=1056816 RepID=UPI0004670393|nr:ABC transporter permease [Nocardia sp. BMG51109]